MDVGVRVRGVVGQWTRQCWGRGIVQVAPPPRRRLEATLLSEVYAPLLLPRQTDRLLAVPRLVAGRYLTFTLRRAELRAAALPLSAGTDMAGRLSAVRDHFLQLALARLSKARGAGSDCQDDARSAAAIEGACRTRSIEPAVVDRLVALAPTDSRNLRRLMVRPEDLSPALKQAVHQAEVLAYLAADVADVRDGVALRPSNAYLAIALSNPAGAREELSRVVEGHLSAFENLLTDLGGPPADVLRRQMVPLLDPLEGPLPQPPAAPAALAEGGVSASVVLFGMLCVVGWLVAYAGIIHRGFTDHTYGVPLAALAANVCWEFAYGFLLDPLADYFHTSSIFGFLVDVVIVAQAFAYGGAQFPGLWVGDHFGLFFAGCLAIAMPVVYFGFIDLDDPDGEYTGFGINLMMSVLYIAMLVRRGSGDGQSLWIASGKGFGTLCAWVATALTVTTTPAQPWPSGWRAFIKGSLEHRTYPLTPLINVMYGWTFVLDAIYTAQLYRQLRADGVSSPWRRF